MTKHKQYFIKHSAKHSKCAPYINVKNKKGGESKKKINNTKKTKKNTLKLNIVSPETHETCLDNKSIRSLIKNYNTIYKKDKIKKGKLPNMFQELKKKVYKDCKNNEVCLVNHKFVSPKLKMKLKNYYKPVMPNKWYSDKNTWLNTLDIDAIFEQYEIKYPEFVFYGPTPIDFDKKLDHYQCVDNELCRINVPQLYKKGIKYIGVVFNLDPHDKGGSHWIAMFCNLEKKEINYWDSYAHKPPNEVTVLMHKIRDQCKKIGKQMKINITSNRHQYGNSECGVYCTHFIISLLEGESFEKLTKTRIPDDVMNTYRSKYFLPL